MKLYNLPISLNHIETIFFKSFPISSRLKKLKSNTISSAIIESVNQQCYYVYEIDNKYYCCESICENKNQESTSSLTIINIPNIYMNENDITYLVNILNMNYQQISRKNEIKVNDVYVLLSSFDFSKKKNDDLLIRCTYEDQVYDYSSEIYDIIINNKHTSFIGLNPNVKIIYKDKNVLNDFLIHIFLILKILSILELFYNYENIFIMNDDSQDFVEKDFKISNVYKSNLKNIKRKDIILIFDFLKNTNQDIYI